MWKCMSWSGHLSSCWLLNQDIWWRNIMLQSSSIWTHREATPHDTSNDLSTCILLYMIMCIHLAVTSARFKWELMLNCLHCPTFDKVFLPLLALLYSIGPFATFTIHVLVLNDLFVFATSDSSAVNQMLRIDILSSVAWNFDRTILAPRCSCCTSHKLCTWFILLCYLCSYYCFNSLSSSDAYASVFG